MSEAIDEIKWLEERKRFLTGEINIMKQKQCEMMVKRVQISNRLRELQRGE